MSKKGRSDNTRFCISQVKCSELSIECKIKLYLRVYISSKSWPNAKPGSIKNHQ